jgi:excisionase family DNA binding protein
VTDDAGSVHHATYDLMDTAEAAAILGITPGGVRYLADAGRIPAHRAGGRRLYPARAVVERAERQAARRSG